MNKMDKRLFHYTVGHHIDKILSDGKIKTETDGGVPFGNQRPAVWCTFSEEWEETCNKSISKKGSRRELLNKEDTSHYAGGLLRIEVDPKSAPYNWNQWKSRSNVSNKNAKLLEKVAKRRGSDINLWRVSFEPILIKKWKLIERYNLKNRVWQKDEVLSWALSLNNV